MNYSFRSRSRLASLFLQLHKWYVKIVIQGALLLVGSSLVFADPSNLIDPKDAKGILLAPPPVALKEDVTLSYSYVGEADLHSGLGGSLGEQTTLFGYKLMVPLNDRLSLGFGLNYNRLDFGQPSGSALPYNLQTLSASVGANYKISDQWSVFGAVAPRLNLIDGWNQIESQDFQVGGMVGANYEFNQDLRLSFGLAVNPGTTGLPVMPMVGVRWGFAKLWTLNFGFPRTSIDYQILPNLRISPVELGFEGGSFHTSKTYGDSVGMSQLNDRRLDYREVRVGTGADYAVTKNIDVNLTTGAVVYREFDFNDANFSPKVDPAPYVQLGVKVGF
jgi:opacity protein-like surface antigen